MIKEARSLPTVNSGMSVKKFSSKEREDILIENFIGLQKAMTNLSIRFESLSDNISKLITIFEISAKDYLSSKGKSATPQDQELLNKVNILLEQNKAVAKGIVMLDEKLRGTSTPQQSTQSYQSLPNQYSASVPLNNSQMQNVPQSKPRPFDGI